MQYILPNPWPLCGEYDATLQAETHFGWTFLRWSMTASGPGPAAGPAPESASSPAVDLLSVQSRSDGKLHAPLAAEAAVRHRGKRRTGANRVHLGCQLLGDQKAFQEEGSSYELVLRVMDLDECCIFLLITAALAVLTVRRWRKIDEGV